MKKKKCDFFCFPIRLGVNLRNLVLSCIGSANLAFFQASECLLCENGTFAQNEQSWTCDSCINGTFAADMGATECDACPLGTFSTGQKKYRMY